MLNAFTDVTADRARAKAGAGCRSAAGRMGPLAGVPFAVKNLFEWRACRRAPARRSTATARRRRATRTLIERLEAAGAVLVGALNMGEYAYDFTGENVHDGPSRNPHDPTRMTGGSSGGSGGAVGGGLVPLALGSDTNGSIRVPSSFCGMFGLKPTYGRLSRAGTFPFVASSIISGRSRAASATWRWPTMPCRAPMPTTRPARRGRSSRSRRCSAQGIDGLRIAVAGGYFRKGVVPEALEAVARVAKALDATRDDRDSRGRARARRGLRHHHDRRRRAASRPPAHARRTISIPPCATG